MGNIMHASYILLSEYAAYLRAPYTKYTSPWPPRRDSHATGTTLLGKTRFFNNDEINY